MNDFNHQNQNYDYPPNGNANPYQQYYQPNSNPNSYEQNNYQSPNPEFEKRAREIKTLGIGSIVLSILCTCCCSFIGILAGAVGLTRANELEKYFEMLSPMAKYDLNSGKKCCMIGIALGWICFIINMILNHDWYF